MHNKLKHKLIKYLEENFNAEIIHKTELQVFFYSDLHIVDLPTVVKAFKGELSIDEDEDALVDNCNKLLLYIINDNSPFVNANQSILTIFW